MRANSRAKSGPYILDLIFHIRIFRSAYSILAPLVFVSCPRAIPTCLASSSLKEAARHTEAGKQALVTPFSKCSPRAPLGPSETFIRGIPSLSIGFVSQKFEPANSRAFSLTVIFFTNFSRSGELHVAEPMVKGVKIVTVTTANAKRKTMLGH